ncbi:MAG: hypothetical protein AAF570_27775, partial [Bacteroidota bacterium]
MRSLLRPLQLFTFLLCGWISSAAFAQPMMQVPGFQPFPHDRGYYPGTFVDGAGNVISPRFVFWDKICDKACYDYEDRIPINAKSYMTGSEWMAEVKAKGEQIDKSAEFQLTLESAKSSGLVVNKGFTYRLKKGPNAFMEMIEQLPTKDLQRLYTDLKNAKNPQFIINVQIWTEASVVLTSHDKFGSSFIAGLKNI